MAHARIYDRILERCAPILFAGKNFREENAGATKQLEQAQERIAEVSRIIKRLYEDNVNGKISDERFMEMSADYEQEQRELKDVYKRQGLSPARTTGCPR